MGEIQSCPYYTADEIATRFPLRNCDKCGHMTQSEDGDLVYCDVVSADEKTGGVW